MKYTKNVLERAVRKSISVAGVLRELGLRQAGGTHHYLTQRIRALEIDTSHFLGKAANRGEGHRGGPKKRRAKEILRRRKSGYREKAHKLRRALLEIGRPYRCGKCGLEGLWLGAPLMLQVDHKNRDFLDDRPENLQFICPNCHSQTEGWCGSLGLSDVTTVARQDREWLARQRKSSSE